MKARIKESFRFILIVEIMMTCSKGYSQILPDIKFNHLYYVMEAGDLKSFNENEIIRNRIAAVENRTTHANAGESWTGTYLYGMDNYIELFDTTGYRVTVGSCGIGLSVDKPGELEALRKLLMPKFKLDYVQRKLKINEDVEIPWFDALIIKDSSVNSLAEVWIMEYKLSFFKYLNLTITHDSLTRRVYLEKFKPLRQDKVIQNFTGVTLKLSANEFKFFATVLKMIGYKGTSQMAGIISSEFLGPDNFRFTLLHENGPEDIRINSISFYAPGNQENKIVPVTFNISIHLSPGKGTIYFSK